MTYKSVDEYFYTNGIRNIQEVRKFCLQNPDMFRWQLILFIRSRLKRPVLWATQEDFFRLFDAVAEETPKAITFLGTGPCRLHIDKYDADKLTVAAVQHEEGIEVPYDGVTVMVLCDKDGSWILPSDSVAPRTVHGGDTIYVSGPSETMLELKGPKVINLRNRRKLKM